MKKGFCGLHPVTNLIFFLSLFVTMTVTLHPFLLGITFVLTALYVIKLRGRKAVKEILGIVLPVIILVAVVNLLFNHGGVTEIGVLPGGNRMTLESIVYGFFTALKAADIILLLSVFNEMIDGDKFIYLFGRFSPRTALVISMALRFVPLMREQSEEIRQARLGLGLEKEGFSGRIKSAVRILSVLITRVTERAIETADSMKSRGYGQKKRSFFNQYRFSGVDFLIITLTSVIFVILCVFAATGVLYSSFNPIIEFESRGIVFAPFLLLTALLLLPLIFDLKEGKGWNLSKRKI